MLKTKKREEKEGKGKKEKKRKKKREKKEKREKKWVRVLVWTLWRYPYWVMWERQGILKENHTKAALSTPMLWKEYEYLKDLSNGIHAE